MIVGGVDKTWAADMVDMSVFSRDNKGYKFLLSSIDIFIKFGSLVPLKDKVPWCEMPSSPSSSRVFQRNCGQTKAMNSTTKK